MRAVYCLLILIYFSGPSLLLIFGSCSTSKENQYVKSSRITNVITGMFKLIFNHVLILF